MAMRETLQLAAANGSVATSDPHTVHHQDPATCGSAARTDGQKSLGNDAAVIVKKKKSKPRDLV